MSPEDVVLAIVGECKRHRARLDTCDTHRTWMHHAAERCVHSFNALELIRQVQDDAKNAAAHRPPESPHDL